MIVAECSRRGYIRVRSAQKYIARWASGRRLASRQLVYKLLCSACLLEAYELLFRDLGDLVLDVTQALSLGLDGFQRCDSQVHLSVTSSPPPP